MATRTPTYYTGTITGQAGTLITVLDAILVTGEGWTKTYSGTNKAVYTQATGNGFCFRVLDDGSGAGGAKEAEVRAAESASDVDTLVDPFPTVAQVSNANCTWRKSDTADSTTRSYWCVADGNFFALIIGYGGIGTRADMYLFGDIEPYYSGDGYNTIFTTRNASNNDYNGTLQLITSPTIVSVGTSIRCVFARSADGLIKSDASWIAGNSTYLGYTNYNVPAYPCTPTNKLHLGFVRAWSAYSNTVTNGQNGAMFRGVIPHMLEPILGIGSGVLAHGDTFVDSAYEPTSNSLVLLQVSGGTLSASPRVVFQVAGTWDPGF